VSPGLVDRDGETHVRVTSGLVLSKRRFAGLIAGVVFLFAVPDLVRVAQALDISFFQLGVIHRGLVFGFAAVGLNLLLRHTELVSFGHAAFFGTGAYTAAVAAVYLDVTSLLVLLLLATALGTVMAGIIGALSLRHTGLYFALLTLAFGQLLYAIALGQSALGGSDGMPVRPGEANEPLLFGQALGDAYGVVTYYITAVVVLVGLLVMWRIVNSPFRYALDAIGQDRTRAEFIGLPVRKYVWTAFVISGVYGGVAGGLFAVFRRYVTPDGTLYFLQSGDILYMAILGGFKTLLGPLVGGVVLIVLEFVGRSVTPYFEFLTGTVLLILVFGFPEGIVGSLGEGGVFRRAVGRTRHGIASLREDPSVAGDWGRRIGRGLRQRIDESFTTLRVVLFGVS